MIPGLLIPDEGSRARNKKHKFDSTKLTLPIDLEADPKHYDTVDLAGGSALSLALNESAIKEETLLRVRHRFGYVPLVLVYFYVLSETATGDNSDVDKYHDEYLELEGYAFGGPYDFLTYKVDSEWFEIKHYLASIGFLPAFTSEANKYQIRVKYYITTIPTTFAELYGLDPNSFFP